jgi:hypothetical protein
MHLLAKKYLLSRLVQPCMYQLGKELFLGKPAQAACRGQRRLPLVKPRAGVVLLGFFFSTTFLWGGGVTI